MQKYIIYFSLRVEQKHIPSRFLRPEHKKKKLLCICLCKCEMSHMYIVLFYIIIRFHSPDEGFGLRVFLTPTHSRISFRILFYCYLKHIHTSYLISELNLKCIGRLRIYWPVFSCKLHILEKSGRGKSFIVFYDQY